MAAMYVRTSVPGVYKRGSRYVATFTDPAGVRRKRSTTTVAEARLLKSSLTADVARGEYREQSRIRFDDYVSEWVRTFQGRTARGIRPRTRRSRAVSCPQERRVLSASHPCGGNPNTLRSVGRRREKR